jgi:hypothetical protein
MDGRILPFPRNPPGRQRLFGHATNRGRNDMKRILLLLAAMPLALPAFAQEAPTGDMPCSEFAALAPVDQETALAVLPQEEEEEAAEVAVASEAEELLIKLQAFCPENPDMMLSEAAEEAMPKEE